uniref:Ig-like domain-containing protein n=1 Tax=Pelusios castaneus TaxID=367368 RepID=A0A8C8RF40_9SAUR
FIILLLPTGRRLAQSDSVSQSPPEARISAGQSVTLHCNFTTLRPDPYLFWYRQFPNQPPEHILTKSKFDAPDQTLVHGKFSASLFSSEANETSTALNITDLELSDTAVYHCALQRAQNPSVPGALQVGTRDRQSPALRPTALLGTTEQVRQMLFLLHFSLIWNSAWLQTRSHRMCRTPVGSPGITTHQNKYTHALINQSLNGCLPPSSS